jgi:MFS family permease
VSSHTGSRHRRGVLRPLFRTLHGLVETATTGKFSVQRVVAATAASGYGRVVPNLIAGKIGSLNIFAPAAVISALLAFCWIAINSVLGLVVFGVLYGVSSGAIVSTLSSPDMKNIGTRMGMAFAIASVGLLIGNPIAGALLKGRSNVGLQVFSGAYLLVCAF